MNGKVKEDNLQGACVSGGFGQDTCLIYVPWFLRSRSRHSRVLSGCVVLAVSPQGRYKSIISSPNSRELPRKQKNFCSIFDGKS